MSTPTKVTSEQTVRYVIAQRWDNSETKASTGDFTTAQEAFDAMAEHAEWFDKPGMTAFVEKITRTVVTIVVREVIEP